MRTIKEKAYAKVNLYLDVLGKLENGYHNLEMVIAPLALHDTLTFKKRKDDLIELTTSKTITGNIKDNLVYRIAKYLQEQYLIKEGVSIELEKNIPIGAGLGGGSADAAATLRGLNKLWKLNLSLDELAQLGKSFGADIPYCIYNKICIARGVGDELVFLNNKLNYKILLIYPNIHMSTKEVYANVKIEELPTKKMTRMTEAVYNRNFDLLTQELYNALEISAFDLVPKLKDLKTQIEKWKVEGVLMSGSGSTIYILTKDYHKLTDIEKVYRDKYQTIITKIK
ncbi:MAG: 4-(cytidine 5'-diphospho)-2-C-methyl-D-erythritol kinase [Candidatus Izemoplasma sp.]|nr:4-(cytidine 5'-diphospho)-2-C-methyl-D-erythritol kinase [Candidatus Izemoplasma sp.]